MAIIGNVSPTDLITSTWGNTVGNELDERCVKVNGAIGDGVTPNQWMTGSLVINASPGVKLRNSGNNPYIQFESTTATVLGVLQCSTAGLEYRAQDVGDSHRFMVAGVEKFQIDNAGVDVTGALDLSGALTTSGITSDARVTVGGNGELVRLIDTSTSGSDFHDCFVGYYGAGVSLVSPGTRTGYVGFASSTTLQVHNEVTGGAVSLATTGSGGIILTTGTGNISLDAGGVVAFSSGGTERGRVAGSLLWGKTVGGIATPGVELFETGTLYSTTATNAAANVVLRHNTNADAASYISFTNASGTSVCEISQDTVAPTGIYLTHAVVQAASDYRLKNDLGPIVDAMARVMQLQPKHLAWKETGAEFDGFIAHELAPVVPEAVYGEKDAVYDADEAERLGMQPGDIKPQGVNMSPVVPLLAAGLQELADRVAALEDM